MWNCGTTAFEPDLSDKSFVLTNDVFAMQIIPQSDRGDTLSPGHRLPRGARVRSCGIGFDSDTVRVAYGGQYYFVFRKDLEPH